MNCNICNITLDSNNWLPSRKNRNQHICKNCVRINNNKRYYKNKNTYLNNNKKTRLYIKTKVFEYYGNCCVICNQKDINKLSLDHINNGRKHRKEVLKTDSGTNFYKWVLKHKPNNLRILCFNCNCKINMNKIELNVLYNSNCKYCNNIIYRGRFCKLCYQINKRNQYIDLKLKVFEAYGNKCNFCSEDNIEYLTIDHINNDGAQHRKIIGTQIFPFLKRNNFPKDFQILCFNCNYLKHKSL